MKMIKRGLNPQDESWHGKCNSCNSEFEAPRSELSDIKTGDQRDDPFCWYQCPNCGTGDESGSWAGNIFFRPTGKPYIDVVEKIVEKIDEDYCKINIK